MINTIFFGINIILLIAMWNFMIKRTLLDYYRDQLFDLRSEVRAFFLDKGIALDSSSYKNLRDLINGHLRFTERITFARFIVLETEVKNNKDLQAFLKDEIEKRFSTSNPELREFTSKVRERSKVILLNHMVNSSGFVWVIALCLAPAVVFYNIFKLIKLALKSSLEAIANGLLHSLKSIVGYIFSITWPIKVTVKRDLLEEYSFRFDRACFA